MQQRHVDLLRCHAEAYAIPLDTALFLYRRNPKPSRPFVLSSLGGLDATSTVQAVAAAARDAWEAQDWKLLGQLAYRFDLMQSPARWNTWQPWEAEASAPSADAESTSPMRDEELELTVRVRAAFQRAFDFARGAIPADGYVRSAIGYFSALPEQFIPPPSLSSNGQVPVAAPAWEFWTLFSGHNTLAWQSVTSAWDVFSTIHRPYLPAVMDRLRQPAEGKPPRLKRLKNPFAAPAGVIGLEPRRRRAVKKRTDEAVVDSPRGARP
jgi:hypothetical protein